MDEIARLESVKRELEQQLEEMGTKAHQAELEKERRELRLEQLETELAALRRAAEESKADFERLLQVAIFVYVVLFFFAKKFGNNFSWWEWIGYASEFPSEIGNLNWHSIGIYLIRVIGG